MDNLGQEGERKRECVRVWVRGNVKERRGRRGEGGGGGKLVYGLYLYRGQGIA